VKFSAPRFWLPYGEDIPLLDDGFMPEPTDPWLGGYVPDFRSLKDLDDTPFLTLIGEPGLGKTTALRAEFERVRAEIKETKDHAHWVRLGSTRQEDVLERRIFESSPYKAWAGGEGRLFLFLDALDEARLRIARVADLLLDGLEDAPFERLILRLSCRSANRHPRLEGQLKQRFGEQMSEVRELAPLTKADARRAAATRNLSADELLTTIIDRDLQPLAMIPESLNFLLDVAQDEGDLPADRGDAYERGLLLLASEPDEDRRTGETAGQLSSSARLALASRIAAALVLSGRTSVRMDQRRPKPDEAGVAQFEGGSELDPVPAVPTKVAATADGLLESLNTAVFSSHGETNRGFGQASYAEFLCARWLAKGRLTGDQIDDLLFMDTGGRLRVVPQLREVATWLANVSGEFFAQLLERDPTVLLRADPAGLDAEGRRRLVDALIAGVGSYEVDRWDRRMRAMYPRLVHPGLSQQLRDVIVDPNAPTRARQVACDVAGACELASLEADLVELALQPDADAQVRLAALVALGRHASGDVRERLRPLAMDSLADDPDDELKGAALSAVWPDQMTADELVAALTPPKRTNLYGMYQSFLRTRVLERLSADDLPIALRWAATLPVEHFPTDALSELREGLLIRAWPILEVPKLTGPYVDVVVSLLTRNANLLSHQAREEHPEAFTEDARRRLIVERLVPRLSAGDLDVSAVVVSTPPLAVGADTAWFVEQLLSAVGSVHEEGWAGLIEAVVSMGVGGDDALVMEARRQSAQLRRLTSYRYDAIPLGSTRAKRARERYERWQQLEREGDEEPARFDIAGHVRAAIDQAESGDLNGFWLATRWLELDSFGRHSGVLTSDISALPGWDLLTDDDRRRLGAIAPAYLRDADFKVGRWFGGNNVYWPAWAGYRALRWLRDEDGDTLDELGDDVWSRWAPIILHWPRDGDDERDFNDWAVDQLAQRAPEVAAEWLGRLLDRDLRARNRLSVLDRIRQIWNAPLEQALLGRARRTRLLPERRAELLEVLIRNGSVAAAQHARRLVIPAALKAGGRRRDLALQVAGLLAAESRDADWDRIWPLVVSDEHFGKDLVAHLAATREREVASRLSPRDAAALYEWVLERFPFETDPVEQGAHWVSPREQIGDWRNGILRALVAQGTREAVRELSRLTDRHPELLGLPSLRREAEELVQRSEWTPPAPEGIVSMADNASKRHVRSAADLRRVLISSLERAQSDLQGLTPAVYDLWDAASLRPKPERLVAAWLERHLKKDLAGRGIVLGREVEVRAHPKGQMGEAVDILIVALAGPEVEGAPQVAVSFELKCCWHADVDTAMEDQLVDRYLDEEVTQGIYAVAFFDSADWDAADNRRQRCRRRDLETSWQFFDDQAASINARRLATVSSFVLDCTLATRRS
jgi:hypothetical protein